MDCHEKGCPGPLSFVPKSYASLRPDLKMMETMGQRIDTLEALVVDLTDWFNGHRSDQSYLRDRCREEAAKIKRGRRNWRDGTQEPN